ncbi:FAD-dependent monooxygenase, partial [Burkholderia sp. Tr-20390]|uniref:FAD-dependent monooxygenase n=1 Tax=Burkholderia sp. Tr-20390 TaxID=2703904 RepID=UPI001F127361
MLGHHRETSDGTRIGPQGRHRRRVGRRLFAATALRAAGWDVGVFEQSPHDLDSRGGGIVLQPPIERAFAFGNVPLPREAAVDSIDRIYVDAHDRIVQRFTMPQTQTAWNVIYTALKRALPAGIVHTGDAFERFEQDGERIVAHFASGHAETADLLIGADGGRSAVRAQLMPDVRPTYAGYVAWRGLVVSVTRFRCTTGSGCAADPANGLHKIVRAHGNTAEYAPFL